MDPVLQLAVGFFAVIAGSIALTLTALRGSTVGVGFSLIGLMAGCYAVAEFLLS